MPKKALTTEVVLRAQPPQSIIFVAVEPATVMAHPNGSISVIVVVQASVLAALEDDAHEVTVAVASTVRIGVAHSFERLANSSSECNGLEFNLQPNTAVQWLMSSARSRGSR
jgi:hypothetical protein